MASVSKRISDLKESATIKMSQMSREMIRSGIDVINLSLGEPDFDTPEHIKEAAIQAIKDGYTNYPPVPGFLELREALSEKFQKENGLNYDADQVVVSTGAKQSCANIIFSVLNSGDELITPAPYWVSYAAQVQLAGGKIVPIPTHVNTGYKITPEQLEAAISERTKIFLLCSPCNPTGAVYSQEELEGLATVLLKYPDVLVISDEIYEHINFTNGHWSFGAIEGMLERTVTVNGFSKGFAMTGWRIGYVGAPSWLAKASSKMQGQFTSGANSITQIACITAIKGDMNPTWEMKAAFEKRKAIVMESLEAMPGVIPNNPEGAFYVFPEVKSYFGKSDGDTLIQNSNDLSMYLLQKGHVSLVTGSAFGAPDGIRVSYAASSENLVKAMDRMGAALAKLS